MHNLKAKLFTGLVALLAVGGLALAHIPSARAGEDNRAPDLPFPQCQKLQVEPGHKVAFHAYALGVQIYRWNGATWDFLRPEATLYSDANYRGKVGTHYGGPTWESNSGSNVVGKRLDGCSADSTAIDWLLLNAVSSDGPGIFGGVTHIQRVNTAGGKAPTNYGSSVGEEKRIPYTAEYYF
jgi:hypothetical protein